MTLESFGAKLRRTKFTGATADVDKGRFCSYETIFHEQLDLFNKVYDLFGDERQFHDPYDSDCDSEFSEGEEMFDCPKRVNKENKRNVSIATFENIMKKNKNQSLCNVKPIQGMSGFESITMKLTSHENRNFPSGSLPQLKIELVSSGCQSRRQNFSGAELISGFVNFGHIKSSQKDHRIPLYHRDQTVYIPEEVLYKMQMVKKMSPDEQRRRA